jgi:nucleoside phosphorylase
MKHEDYTIGWVCALPMEVAAAVSLLDEKHEGLAIPAFDGNTYTLGRIGDHNVVIASLPAGALGSAAAAAVATSMAASFPRLRFALMVGIGGGVPNSEHDIRLGDVVVSTPNNIHGGVIQYDFGKAFAGGKFTKTGALHAPPPVLRVASAELRRKHLIGKSGLLHFNEESVKKYPALVNRYNYPGEERDLLFESTYKHPRFSSTCEHCDHDRLIRRPKRHSQTPAIHYGSIATGNVVIKDALVRDQLGAELGVLCIEMEAAGLMNSFPSLVIRGISDYSDSHKNKDWQFYAAFNAAAYAKEFICTVPAHAVQASDTVADTFDLDINSRDPFQSTDINSETSSVSNFSGATLVDESDQSLINTAAEEVAHVLLEDVRFKGLCSMGVIRQSPPVFRRNISTVLVDFGRTMRKTARTPLERAVAWILIHRRENIAFTIFETVSPAQDQAAKTLRLDQIPVAEQELLQQFINERFGMTQPKMSLQAVFQAEDVDYEAQEQAEVEKEDEDPPPELSLLVEPHNFQQILCESEASLGARKKLKLAVCPITSQQLEKVLQRHIPRDAGSHAVNCLIEWELLAYMDSESVLESELDSVFTITGDLDCAQAVRLGDYMSHRWTTGNAMLSAIKTLIGPFFHGIHGKNKGMSTNVATQSCGVNSVANKMSRSRTRHYHRTGN